MKRSPIVDTGDETKFVNGKKIIVHDGIVPSPRREDLTEGDIIIRRSGGYTCVLAWDSIGRKRCWNALRSSGVEEVALWLMACNPHLYSTITWSEK